MNINSLIIEAIRRPEKVKDVFYDADPESRAAAFKLMRHVSTHDIHAGLDDQDEDVRHAAILHPNVNLSHLKKALNDPDIYVRSAAIQHPNIPVRWLLKIANAPAGNDIDESSVYLKHVAQSVLDGTPL